MFFTHISFLFFHVADNNNIIHFSPSPMNYTNSLFHVLYKLIIEWIKYSLKICINKKKNLLLHRRTRQLKNRKSRKI